MNEAKAGLSRKEEDWVKSFSISTTPQNSTPLEKTKNPETLLSYAPEAAGMPLSPLARNQLPCIFQPFSESECSQRNEGSYVLGSLPRWFHYTDSSYLITMC